MRVVAALVAAAALLALAAAAATLLNRQASVVYANPPAEAMAAVDVYCYGTPVPVGGTLVNLPYSWYAYIRVTAKSHGPGFTIDEVASPDGSRTPVYLPVPPGGSVSDDLPSPFTLPTRLYTRAMPGDVYRVDLGLRKVVDGVVGMWRGAPQGSNDTSPVDVFPSLYPNTGPVLRNETDLYIPGGSLSYWGSELVGSGRLVVAEYRPYSYATSSDIPAFIQMAAGGRVAGVYQFGNGTFLVAGPGANYTIYLGRGAAIVALDASDGTVRAYVNGSVFILGNFTSTPTVHAGAAGTATRPVYLAIVIDRSASMGGAFEGIADGIYKMMTKLARYNIHYALVEYVGRHVPPVSPPPGLRPPSGYPAAPVWLNSFIRIWTDFTTNYKAVAEALKRLGEHLGGPFEPQIAAVYAAVRYLSWPAGGNAVKVIALIGNEGLQNMGGAWPPNVPDWIRKIGSCEVAGIVPSDMICPEWDWREVARAAEWVREQAHARGIRIFVIGERIYYKYLGDVYIGPLTAKDAYMMGQFLVNMSIELARQPLGSRYEFFAVFRSRFITIDGLWPGDRVFVAGGGRLVSLVARGPRVVVDTLRYWTVRELIRIVESGGFRVWVVPSPAHLLALLPHHLFVHAVGDGVDAWLDTLVGYRIHCTPYINASSGTLVRLWLYDGMVAMNVSTDGGRTWAFLGTAPYVFIAVRPGGKLSIAGETIQAGGWWRGVKTGVVYAALSGSGDGTILVSGLNIPLHWRTATIDGPADVELRYG